MIPITVTALYLLADGRPAAGAVDFLLTAELWDGTELAPATTITAPLDSNGVLCDPVTGDPGVILFATDDPAVTPTGAAYRVTERITGALERVYYVSVPYDAPSGTVALGTLVPGTTAPPIHYELTGLSMPPPFVVTRTAGIDVVTWDSGAADPGDVLTYSSPTLSRWVSLATLGGDKSYTHIQGVAATTWVVLHSLNKYPSVSIVDSAGSQVWGSVVYDSADQCTLSFALPFSGFCYCN